MATQTFDHSSCVLPSNLNMNLLPPLNLPPPPLLHVPPPPLINNAPPPPINYAPPLTPLFNNAPPPPPFINVLPSLPRFQGMVFNQENREQNLEEDLYPPGEEPNCDSPLSTPCQTGDEIKVWLDPYWYIINLLDWYAKKTFFSLFLLFFFQSMHFSGLKEFMVQLQIFTTSDYLQKDGFWLARMIL